MANICIICPIGSGSLYYNYKNFYSIVLIAVVDANYNFLYCYVGANGRAHDASIWAQTELFHRLATNSANLPPPECLPYSERRVPYVLVADAAFPLSPFLIKGFSFVQQAQRQRALSYRVNRARQSVECAFGILQRTFGVFDRPICLAPAKAMDITLACVTLHNMLGVSRREIVPQTWANRNRPEMVPLQYNLNDLGRGPMEEATRIRNTFADYFMAEGRLR